MVRKPVCSRALAIPRSARSTTIGSKVDDVVSAKVSATPSQEDRDEDDPHLHVSGEDRRTEDGEDHRAGEVDAHDDATAVVAVGERAGIQAEKHPRQPLEQRRHRDEHGIAGHRRDKQRPSGQLETVADIAHPGG